MSTNLMNPTTAERDAEVRRILARQEEQESTRKQINAWQLAEAKRERAPRYIGLFSGVITAAVTFGRKVNTELSKLVGILVKDATKFNAALSTIQNNPDALTYSNLDMLNIVEQYKKSMRGVKDEKTLPEILKDLEELSKTQDPKTPLLVRVARDEFVKKASKIYQDTAQKATQLEELGDHKSAIVDLWESAYLTVVQLREKFRDKSNIEFIRSLRESGDTTFTIKQLSSETLRGVVAETLAASLAVGAIMYQAVRFITREKKEEREARVMALAEHLEKKQTEPVASEMDSQQLQYAANVVLKESKDFRQRLNAERELSSLETDVVASR